MKRYILSHQKNIRDLGGMIGFENRRIKEGCLFRGGALSKLNDEDIEVVKSFNLTDVVDFRSKDEFLSNPDYRLEGVTYHNFPALRQNINKEDKKIEDGNLLWFLDEDGNGFTHLRKTYGDIILTEEGQTALKNYFKVISKSDRRCYFHCSQGKDRAGIAAFLTEIALGVNINEAIKDYLLSNEAMQERIPRLIEKIKDRPFYNEEYEKSLIDVFSAKMDYINEMIEKINLLGGFDYYLLKILKVDVNLLRSLYLEK